jgi:hypothetical protein
MNTAGKTWQRDRAEVFAEDRELRLRRYTQPEPELRVLLEQLKLALPAQPPPQITTTAVESTMSV